MTKTTAIPVVCEQRALGAKFGKDLEGKDLQLASYATLHVSALGVEAFGWSITMRQLYLVLEAASCGEQYVKAATTETSKTLAP